eukprot:3011411-Pyramimonas_sp.AAC.1
MILGAREAHLAHLWRSWAVWKLCWTVQGAILGPARAVQAGREGHLESSACISRRRERPGPN